MTICIFKRGWGLFLCRNRKWNQGVEQQVWQRFPEKLGGSFEIVKSFLVEA